MSFIDELRAQSADKIVVDLNELENWKEKVYFAIAEINVFKIKEKIRKKVQESTERKIVGYHSLSIENFNDIFFCIDRGVQYAVFKLKGHSSNYKEIENAGYKYSYSSYSNESSISFAINPKIIVNYPGFWQHLIFNNRRCYIMGEQSKIITDKIIEMGKKDDIAIIPYCQVRYDDDYKPDDFFELGRTVSPSNAVKYGEYFVLKYEASFWWKF